MAEINITKSIDTFTIEVYQINGSDYVDIRRSNLSASKPDITFLKGESAGAAAFLAQLAELFGVGKITIGGESNES